MTYYPDPEVFISQERISERVAELGEEITKDYKNKLLNIIAISNGAVIFAADLIRKIRLPLHLDVVSAASYSGTESSREVELQTKLKLDISGRHVLIVDDILDTGRTISKVKEFVEKQNPADIRICMLLDKPSRRIIDLKSDYAGFDIPDKFVVGYGLDYNERYRNLPYIGLLPSELSSKV